MSSVQELDLLKDHDDVIVSGSTWAAIWHMSWPLLLQMATISIASFADVWVAGKMGSDVQAAIGIGGQVWFLMIMMATALSAGATALVSRFWGARDFETAAEAAKQSILFAVFFGVASAAIGLAIGRPMFRMLGASPAVEELGWQFLSVDMISQIPFTIVWVCHSIFRAKGNARIPMAIWAMMTIQIIALDLFFCLGPCRMGIAGLALSWLIASAIGVAVNFFLLSRSDIKECLNFSTIWKTGISKEWFMRLVNIGLPACIQDIAWIGGNFVLFLIFAQTPDPTSCQASWSVGLRLEEMVSCMPIYALAMAVATIVGQNLGAKQSDRAERAGWQVTSVGVCFAIVVGALLAILAEPISKLMSSDPVVIKYTTQYLQVIGPSQPFVAAWFILFGAMQGAGYTKWPMWASAICLTFLRVPLAWSLTVPMALGPLGTWIGVAVSSVVVGLVAIWRFKTGIWKYHKV